MIRFGLILFLVFACNALTESEISEEWKTFLEQTQKSYRSPAEATRRYSIFKDNLEKIEFHNKRYEKGLASYKMGVTQFTDLTKEEFLAYVNKYKMVPEKSGYLYKARQNFTAGPSVDWRQQGAVTYVKNQGQCGACWSFSTTGSLEGQAALKLGQPLVLSEQNLMDCATQFNCMGCNGGTMTGALTYVAEYGIDSENDYPYEAVQGPCRQREIVLQIRTYANVYQNEQSLLQAVTEVGPISIAMDATDALQNYASGVFYDPTCTSQCNHGVLLVGYGTENGEDYWIIKNSWGDFWGEAGYFRLIRGYAACGITTMASFPML